MSVAIFSALLIDIRSLQSKHFAESLFIPKSTLPENYFTHS